MAYATADDVQARYEQDLDDRLQSLVNTRLGDAELLIKHRIPDLDDQVTAGTLDVEIVKLVESEMVLRLIRNPEGYSQESDGNYSYAIYQQVASGKLEVTEDEWGLLGTSEGLWILAPTLEENPPIIPADPSLAWQVNLPYGYAVGSADAITGWWPH